MDPDVEKRLKELEKKSKYAPLREVSQKIRQGVYEENAKQLKKNKKNLTKKLAKWKRKMDKGDEKEKKTYLGKFEFGKGLLDLLAGKKKGEAKKEVVKKEEAKKDEKKKVESDSNDNSNSDISYATLSESESENEKKKKKANENSEDKDPEETEEELKKRKEEKAALLKAIGEAAKSVDPPDIKEELTKLASIANPLDKETANEIKKLDAYKDTFEAKTTNFKKGKFELTDSKEPIVLQAIANAARAFLEQQDKVELFPVVQKETLATGDCFYSAIYRSAKERGYLDDLEECLELDITDENAFIQSLRNVIADEIFNDRLPGEATVSGGYLDIYDALVQNYGQDPKMYKLLIQGFPFWFQKRFANGPGDRKTFLTEYAAHTMTMREWVGEIEVKIAQKLFKTYCGIEIQTHREVSDANIEMPKVYKGTPVFHVVNLGEAHYEYYSFKIPIKQIKKASQAVVKKEEKKVEEPCGEFLYDPCTGNLILDDDPITVIQKRLKVIQAKPKKGGTRKRKQQK